MNNNTFCEHNFYLIGIIYNEINIYDSFRNIKTIALYIVLMRQVAKRRMTANVFHRQLYFQLSLTVGLAILTGIAVECS